MKKNKKIKNLMSKILGVISLVACIIFCVLLFLLDMLPTKYLIIFLAIISVIYVICLFLIFFKKIKSKIRTTSVIVLVILGLIFGIGSKYLNDTISFVDVINNKLLQKEAYYIMTLESSKIDSVEDLSNKKIGIYSSENGKHALEQLNKKVKVREFKYKDIVKLFEDLECFDLDAVLINDSIKNLLQTDLSDMDLVLKKIYEVQVSIEKEDIVKVVDVTKKPFNIYVAGGDAYGSIEKVTNTDVNMIVTVNPMARKLLLTSIPRDYYVNLPSFGSNAYDKLTHAGYYGIEESVKSIEKLLDIDINYYIKVNFSTVVGVIDAIGGVDVNSDYAFTAHNDEETEYYKFYVGNNRLNGKEALAFARDRQSFVDGDVQRVKNQQKVIGAVINKATSSTTIITNFSEILDSVSESLSTNMDTKSINKFVKMQLNDMRGWSIESVNLVGTDLLTTETYTFPGTELYVMKQKEESVEATKQKISEYMK